MFLLPGRTPPERGGAACSQQLPASANATRFGFLRSLRQEVNSTGPHFAIGTAPSTLLLASPFPRLSLSVLVASPPVRPTLHPCKREHHIFFPRKTSGGKCKTHSACPAELTFTGFPVHEISCIKRAVEQVLHLEDKGYNPQGKEDWHCSKPKAKRNKVPANRHNCKGSFRGW